MKKEYILVIDSGIGGLSVLSELLKTFPANYLYFADNNHCPYGNHTQYEITEFLTQIIDDLCNNYIIKLIVLACNTATTASIEFLRIKYPNLRFVGTEPAIKLASDMGYCRILSLTTAATARQEKYKRLQNHINSNIKTLPMHNLASNIEQFLCRKHILDDLRLKKDIFFIQNLSKNYDCIVLGCTHYALIKAYLQNFISIPLIDGNAKIAVQTQRCAIELGVKQQQKPALKFVLSSQFSGCKQIYKKILSQILAK